MRRICDQTPNVEKKIMKLFRFLNNLWSAAKEELPGMGDFVKSATSTIALWVAVAVAFYGTGKVARWLKIHELLAIPSGKDDPLSVGAIVIVITIMVVILLFALFAVVSKLKNIWDKS